jgi:hypothetical protein
MKFPFKLTATLITYAAEYLIGLKSVMSKMIYSLTGAGYR